MPRRVSFSIISKAIPIDTVKLSLIAFTVKLWTGERVYWQSKTNFWSMTENNLDVRNDSCSTVILHWQFQEFGQFHVLSEAWRVFQSDRIWNMPTVARTGYHQDMGNSMVSNVLLHLWHNENNQARYNDRTRIEKFWLSLVAGVVHQSMFRVSLFNRKTLQLDPSLLVSKE